MSDEDRVRHIRKAAAKLAEIAADGWDMFDTSCAIRTSPPIS